MKIIKRFWFLLFPFLISLVPWALWLVMRLHRGDSHDPIALLVVSMMMVFCTPVFILGDDGEFLATRVTAISSGFDFAVVLLICLLVKSARSHDTNAA